MTRLGRVKLSTTVLIPSRPQSNHSQAALLYNGGHANDWRAHVHVTKPEKEAIAQAAEQELTSLAVRGVRIAGNACSPIVLVKGDLDEAERSGGELAAGPDGAALRKALGAIGYAPEDFCVLASVAGAGDGAVAVGETLPCELFREALEALDPEAVLLLDNNAADAMRETYADMLVAIDDFDTAMLKPGLVAHVQGRRVLALDGFEAALTDKAAKQRMWAYIKQLTPAAAPL